jgi:hypothetical protein
MNENGINKTVIKSITGESKSIFINNLVDALFTEEINTLIQDNTKTELDKKSFLIFIMTYFYTTINSNASKNEIKLFICDLFTNKDKRKILIELFVNFENTVKTTLLEINKN